MAFLYLFGIPLASIPPIALFFNITASSVAFYRFNKQGYVIPRKIIPFLLTSVPATFIGARLNLNEDILSIIFAAVLVSISVILMFRKKKSETKFFVSKHMNLMVPSILGVVFGFLAGFMGIGGGIFLGPILLLIGYSSSKYIASICSAFVLVNSCVGLTVHYFKGRVDMSPILLLGLVVFLGAQVGSFLGTKKFSSIMVQRIVAVILILVSLKLGLGVLG